MAKKSGSKERVYKVGLADPRTGGERIAASINRVAQGHKKADRKYDDSPSKIAKVRKAARASAKKSLKK